MSGDKGRPLDEKDPAFLLYLQELEMIFPDIDPDTIKTAIINNKEWSKIVEALIPLENQLPQGTKAAEHPQAQAERAKSIPPPKPAKNNASCKLYLPASLISLDVDLEHFGSFDVEGDSGSQSSDASDAYSQSSNNQQIPPEAPPSYY